MNRFDRRTLLQAMGAAGALAASPFGRLGRAAADTPSIPRRIVYVCTPNASPMEHFWPSDGATFSSRILSVLAPLRSKMSAYRGIDHRSALTGPVPGGFGGHAPDNINLLTGTQGISTGGDSCAPGGISIDQHLASTIGRSTRFASLQLGVQWTTWAGIVSAAGERRPNPPENNPYQAFARLFGDGTAVGSATAAARLRARRQSVLDAVAGDLAAARCRLGSDARANFDAHLDAVEQVERSFQTATVTCATPALGAMIDPNDRANYPQVGRLQMDLIAAALACDLTRVVTLQWSPGASNVVHHWAGVTVGHHDAAHGIGMYAAGQSENLAKIETWYAQQFLYLCQRLNAIPEGAGTLLDHTVVVWVHEQSNGANHSRLNMPYVLAGGASGKIRLGQVVDFRGQPHNRLLLALASAMGAPVQAFGQASLCAGGPLPILVT